MLRPIHQAGRLLRSGLPRARPVKRHESFYQVIVEKHLDGGHKKLACGITDVTNHNTHAEIKIWTSFKSAVGQLMVYNNEDPKEHLQAYMFGHCSEEYKAMATRSMQSLGIRVFTFIDDDNIHIIDCETGLVVLEQFISRSRVA